MRVYRNGKWVSLTNNVENFSAGAAADSDDTSSKSNKWLWVGLGVIAAILVAIAVWYMMSKKKSSSSPQAPTFGAGQDPSHALDELDSIMDGL